MGHSYFILSIIISSLHRIIKFSRTQSIQPSCTVLVIDIIHWFVPNVNNQIVQCKHLLASEIQGPSSAQPSRRQLVRLASGQRKTAELKIFYQYDEEMDQKFKFHFVLRDIELDEMAITCYYLQPNKTGHRASRFVDENANTSTNTTKNQLQGRW